MSFQIRPFALDVIAPPFYSIYTTTGLLLTCGLVMSVIAATVLLIIVFFRKKK